MKNKLVLPIGVLTQHLVAMGKTGAGKSSMLRHVVEHLLSENKRVVVIDPKGDWFGLKLSADGKCPGFAVVAFGNFKNEKATDIPITPDSGKAVAELILKGNRPAIIGLRGWMPAEQAKFWVAFASTVFNSNLAGGLNVVVDEVQNFAPKERMGYGNENMALYWSKKLLSEGRGLGLVLFIGSQRPQSVHNGVLTQCETLVAMRLTHDADCSAVEAWLKRTNDKDARAKILTSIPELPRGSAWVWSPEIKFGPEVVAFPMFQTFDSFAPPQNQHAITAGGWAAVDLEDVKREMSVVIEEQKANDPAELKKEISRLRREMAERERHNLSIKPPAPVVQMVEVPVLTKEHEKILTGLTERADALNEDARSIATRAQLVGQELLKLRGEIATRFVVKGRSVGCSFIATDVKRGFMSRSEAVAKLGHPTPSIPARNDGKLSAGERAILTAIVQRGDAGTDKTTLKVLTGYKSTSTGEYVRSVVAKGYATKDGDKCFPTAEGVAALGDFEPLPTGGAELIEFWRKKLSGGELIIFDFILSAGTTAVSKEQICKATDYKATSCGEYLRQLIARQIVERVGAGEYTLTDSFFQ